MAKKYFTPDEVNELIPQLEYHFRKLLLHKKELSKASRQLQSQGIEPELLADIPIHVDAGVRILQEQLQENYQRYQDEIFSIAKIGGEITDLELGRVEFNSKLDQQPARLTWQLGVTEVAHAELVPLDPADEKAKELSSLRSSLLLPIKNWLLSS